MSLLTQPKFVETATMAIRALCGNWHMRRVLLAPLDRWRPGSRFPRTKFVEAIARTGRSVCDDSHLCDSILRDLCGQKYPGESNLIIQAVRHGIARALVSDTEGALWPAVRIRFTRQLTDLGFRDDMACWAVDTWALALGCVAAEELDVGQIHAAPQLSNSTERPILKDLPQELRVILPRGVGLRLVLIPAGSFMMGSPLDEPERRHDEGPIHRVTLAQPFYMGKQQVTQAQWQAIMGNNPSRFRGNSQLPVESVSWDECQGFLENLNRHISGANSEYIMGVGRRAQHNPVPIALFFRLPNEAEWEYACRARTTSPFSTGDNLTTLQANYDGNQSYSERRKGLYRGRTMPIGSFRPNPWGLYDMHGNLWEWCQDWYHDSYVGAPDNGSAWERPKGEYRVLRGGCWDSGASRSAERTWHKPDNCYDQWGLRVAATVV